MQTYLTSQQFAKVFWDIFDTRMSYRSAGANQCDRIIWAMFQQYHKDVMETLEGSLYGIEEFTGDNANELVGYQFHKSFRQVDVIPAKHIDSIVWSCMQDAPMFWKCMERACKTLTNKDLADDFIENGEFAQ